MTTLNQALRRIAALEEKIKQVEARMARSVSYVERKPPPYDFMALTQQRDKLVADKVRLETAATMAEARIQLHDGKNFCQAVFELAEINAALSFYGSLPVLDAARVEQLQHETEYVQGDLTTVTREVVQLCSLPELERNKLLDELRDRLAALETEVDDRRHEAAID